MHHTGTTPKLEAKLAVVHTGRTSHTPPFQYPIYSWSRKLNKFCWFGQQWPPLTILEGPRRGQNSCVRGNLAPTGNLQLNINCWNHTSILTVKKARTQTPHPSVRSQAPQLMTQRLFELNMFALNNKNYFTSPLTSQAVVPCSLADGNILNILS